MSTPLSLPEFQQHHLGDVSKTGVVQAGHFAAYARPAFGPRALPYQRRDFYKLSLLTRGRSQLHQATRSWTIAAPAIVLSHPLEPHAWETLPEEQGGYFCLFTADFLHTGGTLDPAVAPLLALGRGPVYPLVPAQVAAFEHLFKLLLAELNTDYPHQPAVLRHYLHLLLHQVQRLAPPAPGQDHPAASHRLASLFLDLLERQFPLELPQRPLRLYAAQDFARLLGVHVNTLNRAVRAVTGQTTTAYLAARRLAEARRLLRHTAWPVADIADGLGFAYPTHFHNFFKRHAGHTPGQARQQGAV